MSLKDKLQVNAIKKSESDKPQKPKKRFRIIKKVFLLFFSLVFLVFATLVIAPFVIDVDKFRPEIVKMVNEKIKGKLELGKFKLSLWGRILVEVGGVRLLDEKNTEILTVNEAEFYLPFLPILKGDPVISFRMLKPNITVLKEKDGKLNIMSIVPSTKVGQLEQNKKSTIKYAAIGSAITKEPSAGFFVKHAYASEPAVENEKFQIPDLVKKARLDIEFLDSIMNYKDKSSGLSSKLNELNLIIRGISMGGRASIEFWAKLSTKLGESISVAGPFRITGKIDPKFDNSEFVSTNLALSADLTSLNISAGEMFNKKPGKTVTLALDVFMTPKNIDLKKLKVIFHKAVLNIAGKINNLDATSNTTSPKLQTVMDVDIKSDPIPLGDWADIAPVAKDYAPEGSLAILAKLTGPIEKFEYQAQVIIKDLSAKLPMLKANPKIQGEIQIKTNRAEKVYFNIKAPGNDLSISGKVLSFFPPAANFRFKSTGMDIDKLFDFKNPAKVAQASTALENIVKTISKLELIQNAAQAADKKTENYDTLLDPIRNNQSLKDLLFLGNVSINYLKIMDIMVKNIYFDTAIKNLALTLKGLRFRVFEGIINADSQINIKPKLPQYAFKLKVSDLDLKQAIKSQLELFKNTLHGKANIQAEGRGESFNPDVAISKINVKGKMDIKDANFVTIDVSKMAIEALNNAVERATKNIPGIQKKSFNKLPAKEAAYERIYTDFSLSESVFNAPNFTAKAKPGKSLDLSGFVRLNISSKDISAKFEVIDRYNLSGAKDVSVSIAGSDVKNILAQSGKSVSFPVTVGCKITAPCYSYTEAVEHLAKVAASNVGSAARNKINKQVQDKVIKKVEKATEKAPPKVKKAITDLRKKFGF